MGTGVIADLNDTLSHSSRCRIRELEQKLGAQLLRRTTRRVSPTEAGSVYFQQCCHAPSASL
jgi:hypothetical protein